MESQTANAAATWSTPQCPFAIQYVPRVLDDIRLAVVDAFFSLPRGGAEIGGILLGSHSEGRVVIAGYEALDCEHAFGPGFKLSAHDKAQLTRMLAAERPANLRPVGWYHSHTRNEILLSEADVEIHKDYFPEFWQVALVIKPHTFEPARAGFFFREADGEIHRSESYLEFELEQLSVRQIPSGSPSPEKHGPPAERRDTPSRAGTAPPVKVITLAAMPVAEPEPSARAPQPVPEPAAAKAEAAPEAKREPEARREPEPAPVPEAGPTPQPEAAPEVDVPQFLQPPRERSWRWLKTVAAMAVGFAIGSAGYFTHQVWVPQLLAGMDRVHDMFARKGAQTPAVPQAPINLSLLDTGGQLQIRWDRNSPTVRNGGNALLEILDAGLPPRAIPLDEAHLKSGSFTYAREGGRVDVVLAIDQPNGKGARESTTFLGKAPDRPDDSNALRKERDVALQQKAKLEADLKAAKEQNRKLEKSLADARALARIRQRLANQAPK